MKNLMLLFLMLWGSSAVRAANCDYWIAKVDPTAKEVRHVDEKDVTNIIQGIECLMTQEGRKQPGVLSGGKPHISQLFPRASIEINALYQISQLFYGNDDFAQAVALRQVGTEGRFNSARTVRKAFASYRKWLKKVQTIGLEAARKRGLDPLENSGVAWY